MTDKAGDGMDLRLIQQGTCDGVNPKTGMPCILGDHKGYHRDYNGEEWLED